MAFVPPGGPVRETPSVGFADLVRMLAEGVADAQLALDRNSASRVEELAATKVSIVPEVREVVDADGHVTYEQGRPREVSLLELGVTPTFYQFSESKVEVAMDISVVEEGTEPESGEPRLGLRAGTSAVRAERKLNRRVTAHSTLTATLVPVPMPAQLEASRTTVPRASGE
jgi:hypothetical protein